MIYNIGYFLGRAKAGVSAGSWVPSPIWITTRSHRKNYTEYHDIRVYGLLGISTQPVQCTVVCIMWYLGNECTPRQILSGSLQHQVGGLFSQLEGEGRVSELHKIVLSSRSRLQLGLGDQKVWLANNWDQVGKPILS